MLTLEGRRTLVTGGDRGIGRAVSVLFGRLGARVALSYVEDAPAARETVKAIGGAGGEAHALQADLCDAPAGGGLIAKAVECLGGLDILVVNHGIWKRAPIEGMSPAEWQETLGINLDSAFGLCQGAAQHMIPRRAGCIVTIASTAGQRGEAFYSHYAASKGAMIAFTKSLATELAPHGIRVNGVAPGWVLTDMTEATLTGEGKEAALAKIPLGRAARPEEIAGPVAFLASDLASYLYGEILAVNGGAVMMD
jgi:3-oxoacyl-[acyl-carrier protein] reductase